MDTTELDTLSQGADDDDHLVKTLRAALKDQGKENKSLRSKVSEGEAAISGFERSEVFDTVGIPTDGVGKLFRERYAGEDLSVDEIRSHAETYGLLEAPSSEAGEGEQAAHAAVDEAGGPAPTNPLVPDFSAAKTPEEVVEMAAAAGVHELIV